MGRRHRPEARAPGGDARGKQEADRLPAARAAHDQIRGVRRLYHGRLVRQVVTSNDRQIIAVTEVDRLRVGHRDAVVASAKRQRIDAVTEIDGEAKILVAHCQQIERIFSHAVPQKGIDANRYAVERQSKYDARGNGR